MGASRVSSPAVTHAPAMPPAYVQGWVAGPGPVELSLAGALPGLLGQWSLLAFLALLCTLPLPRSWPLGQAS